MKDTAVPREPSRTHLARSQPEPRAITGGKCIHRPATGSRSVQTLPWHGAWLHRAIRGTKFGVFGHGACPGASQPEGGMVSAHRSTKTPGLGELLGYVCEHKEGGG